MRKLSLMAAAVAVVGLAGAQAYAQCGAPACKPANLCNPCKVAAPACAPAPKCVQTCKPAYKWVTVTENVDVEVPVKRWVDKQVEVTVKEKVCKPVEVEIAGWAYQEKEIPCTIRKKVCVPEVYTEYVKVAKEVEKTGVRKVAKKVCEKVDKVVCRTEYDCDPCTGKKTPRKVEETIQVDVWKTVYEEVPYTYTCKVYEDQPIEKTRTKVTYVDEPSTKTVKVKVPTTTTKTVTKVEWVETTKMVNQPEMVCEMVKKTECRTKRVKVAIDPCTGAQLNG